MPLLLLPARHRQAVAGLGWRGTDVPRTSVALSGGQGGLAIFSEDRVEIVHGDLAVFESSPGVERGFCARCGTSLTYRRASRPGLFDVTTASLDDPEAFPPDKEIWTGERLSWEAANPALPQFARFSSPEPPALGAD